MVTQRHIRDKEFDRSRRHPKKEHVSSILHISIQLYLNISFLLAQSEAVSIHRNREILMIVVNILVLFSAYVKGDPLTRYQVYYAGERRQPFLQQNQDYIEQYSYPYFSRINSQSQKTGINPNLR